MAALHLPQQRGKFMLNLTSILRCQASSTMNRRGRNEANFSDLRQFPKPVTAHHGFKKARRSGQAYAINDLVDIVPGPNELVELPLLPLTLVLFPGSTIPLQLFEFRYRIMIQTLLQGDLRFGIIYSDHCGGVADVGCVGKVIKYERLVDDRFFLICKGEKRFRVVDVVRTKPYVVAEVQWVEDCPSMNKQRELDFLALEVETCLKDVIRLSNKLNGKPEMEVADLRRKQFPAEFSFFVASTFEGEPREQQELLEVKDVAVRLTREKETLRSTLNYLAAAAAVKDAFQFSSFDDK